MAKTDCPATPAIRFLREHGVAFVPHPYPYREHGGTAHSAACLHADEHCVIKTIVLHNEQQRGLIMLMHGDRQVSTRQLARQAGMKHIQPASPTQALKWTGYQVGGISPFGLKTPLPVYVHADIWDLERIYINGGKRGLLVSLSPSVLRLLNPHTVRAAAEAA